MNRQEPRTLVRPRDEGLLRPEARVKAKVERFIDEKRAAGRARDRRYILDGVVCESYRSNGRWLCPRAIYPWWRECWSEPADAGAADSSSLNSSDTVTNS